MRTFRAMLADESGAATLWNLTWFLTFVVFMGISIDSTNAYRMKAILQATADSAAHAGVISLPDSGDAVTKALDYAERNMAQSVHGTPVRVQDIAVGWWNAGTQKFTPGGTSQNAVYVLARRTDGQGNALKTQLLHLIGLNYWNIDAEAVAVTRVDDCLQRGIVAQDRIDISSGNLATGIICFHGEARDDKNGIGIDLQNGNTFERGVGVSVPSIAKNFKTPDAAPLYSSNPGLAAALHEHSIPNLHLEICNQINVVLSFANLQNEQRFIDGDNDGANDCWTEDSTLDNFRVRPDWLPESAVGNPVTLSKDDFEALDYQDLANQRKLYFVDCAGKGNDTLVLEGRIEKIAFVTNCQIGGKTKKVKGDEVDDPDAEQLVLSDVLLMSLAVGNGSKPRDKATIRFPGTAEIGTANCGETEGGVHVYGMATIQFPAQGRINGGQFITEGSVKMAAKEDGMNGINVLAGDDVTYTSNGRMGLCPGDNGSAVITTRRYAIAY